ncbi:hypothetical protein [Marinomonas pollencensis]|uniref:Outer membrane OprD family porin n=1 Tax=Marinomonas pollencensis TaxID=491954 RepID=A0A3E0D7E1_9GAMM|nr:hypothetical protein [Marinomonas pollencensis]REG78464.1 hypothetical protein DFP81_12119 [Marinomonas pollencensis]
MKKIPVIMLVSLGTVCASAQAENLQEALSGGTFTGEIRNTLGLATQTDAKASGPFNNAKSLGSAITLDYLTGAYYGFTLGLGAQSGYDWGLQSNDVSSFVGGENDRRVTTDATSLYHAFLQYDFDKTITDTRVRFGRQSLVSPLVMTDGMYPMQDTYDALVIQNKDFNKTDLRFMYISKWNRRYGDDNEGSITEATKEFDNPLVSLYLNNNSIEGLNIEAQWLSNNNDEGVGDPPADVNAHDYDTSFLGLTYKIPDSTWELGAKNLSANFDDSADTGYWGARVKKTFDGIGVQLAYTSVDDAANFPGSLGHVPMFRAYSPGLTPEVFAGLKATSIAVDYNFDVPGLFTRVGYTSYKQSDEGIKNSIDNDLDGGYEASLQVNYKPASIKGLSTIVQLSYMDYDQDVDTDDMTVLRTSLNYKF